MCDIVCQICGNDAGEFPMKIWCQKHPNICFDCVREFNKGKTHPLAIIHPDPEHTFIMCPLCGCGIYSLMSVGFFAGDLAHNII